MGFWDTASPTTRTRLSLTPGGTSFLMCTSTPECLNPRLTNMWTPMHAPIPLQNAPCSLSRATHLRACVQVGILACPPAQVTPRAPFAERRQGGGKGQAGWSVDADSCD
eukprot:1053800-Prorocentrum_minimum.AAC.1